MSNITDDYFLQGKNLFPTEGATDPHLAQLIKVLQQQVFSGDQILTVGTADATYDTIQKALAAITEDETSDLGYLILVGPGTFTENITLKRNVKIQGLGIGLTTIQGRVVSATTGQSAISDLSIIHSSDLHLLDISASSVALERVAIGQNGSGKSIRVTGGDLSAERLNILAGPIEITGGVVDVDRAIFRGLAGSQINGGDVRINSLEAFESTALQIINVISGRLDIGRAVIENTGGSYFVLTGGVLSYQSIFIRDGADAAGNFIKATGGQLLAGAANIVNGVNADADIVFNSNAIDVGDTIFINTVGFQAGQEFQVGQDVTETGQNITDAINNSTNALIADVFSATFSGSTLTIKSIETGAIGNTYALALQGTSISTALTIPGTLSGGEGNTNISSQVQVTNFSFGIA